MITKVVSVYSGYSVLKVKLIVNVCLLEYLSCTPLMYDAMIMQINNPKME